MTSPSNCKRTDWKWRKQINIGRLEAMTEVLEYIRNKKKWYEDIQKEMGPGGARHEAVMAILRDLENTMAANCERGGKWASSVPMECQGPKDETDGTCSCYQEGDSPKPTFDESQRDKQVEQLRALIEKNEDDWLDTDVEIKPS
ncbi:MAG: hypothetical protein ACXABY_10535 [Candidatus Thorarchaeota archaeon]|jgi:hypothetical protein